MPLKAKKISCLQDLKLTLPSPPAPELSNMNNKAHLDLKEQLKPKSPPSYTSDVEMQPKLLIHSSVLGHEDSNRCEHGYRQATQGKSPPDNLSGQLSDNLQLDRHQTTYNWTGILG